MDVLWTMVTICVRSNKHGQSTLKRLCHEIKDILLLMNDLQVIRNAAGFSFDKRVLKK